METGQDVVTNHDLAATPEDSSVFFEGIKLSFTGTARTGDRFYISSTQNTAKEMSVSSAISNNVEKVAASLSGDLSDNQAALDIAALQSAKIMLNGTVTFEEHLGGVLGDLGVHKFDAEINELSHDDLLNQLDMMREEISGVSIDEEMVNLMQFQRSYQASAKLITTLDNMYQTLLDTVKG